ncbi:hypothetical protein EDD22DRAFT_974215 [Suillus occidentalis]|nr:hypothetical protein EDD22DRAFT_974215 [Suillus occidentalis]
MQFMDAYMAATASVSSRHSALKDFPSTLAMDAASCALRSGDMKRLRAPLDSLQTHSDHAAALIKGFRDLSSLLDKLPASHADGTPKVEVDAAATRYGV